MREEALNKMEQETEKQEYKQILEQENVGDRILLGIEKTHWNYHQETTDEQLQSPEDIPEYLNSYRQHVKNN